MEVKVPPSCPILYNFMDCSPPGSFVREILQARMKDNKCQLEYSGFSASVEEKCGCFPYLN